MPTLSPAVISSGIPLFVFKLLLLLLKILIIVFLSSRPTAAAETKSVHAKKRVGFKCAFLSFLAWDSETEVSHTAGC